MPVRDRSWRPFMIVGALLIAAAGFAMAHFWSPHADLRVTTGPPGSTAQRFIAAFVSVSEAQHPRVHLKLVQVDDLAASGKALEEGRTDLAIVRSDVPAPANAQTIAILRRDVVAFVCPRTARSTVLQLGRQDGRYPARIAAVVQFPAPRHGSQLLRHPREPREPDFLPAAELGQAVQQKKLAAVLAVGPVAPGEVVDVVGSIARATKGTPTLLALDEAETIGKRFPGFESIDVPAGAFRAKPATPDDTLTTLAVTYRFAASELMPNIIAGAIARALLTTKAKLMAVTPLASQIEAPDPDAKSPILPIHPGVAAYLSSGDESFFEQSQKYFYVGGLAVSVAGSLFAAGRATGTDGDRRTTGGRSRGSSGLRMKPMAPSPLNWRLLSGSIRRSSRQCSARMGAASMPIAYLRSRPP